MSRRLKKQEQVLRRLWRARKPQTVKDIIKTGGKELTNILCECALNVLRGNVPLKKQQKLRLTPHKKGLRELSDKKTSVKKKTNILQRGGFLSALLGPIIGIVGSLLARS